MKAVLFAGGVGTRLWPLSRKKTPKQFQPIVHEKSTLELAIDRILPTCQYEDIYIATGQEYVEKTRTMFPRIPPENIIGEPDKRDNGPAVAVVFEHLYQQFPKEPVLLLWSDHLVKDGGTFTRILTQANTLMQEDPDKIIFIGQKPRFASENLGWISTSEVITRREGIGFRKLESFKYRPSEADARRFFETEGYCWNLGYFMTTPQYICGRFKELQPDLYKTAAKIASGSSKTDFDAEMKKHYREMPEINLDNAILEHTRSEDAYVVIEDIGWSDIGAWEALKEALSSKPNDNVTKGLVRIDDDSEDNLVYNMEKGKLVVCEDINDMVIVNTGDVMLVTRKSSASRIKKFVESLRGTDLEHYT